MFVDIFHGNIESSPHGADDSRPLWFRISIDSGWPLPRVAFAIADRCMYFAPADALALGVALVDGANRLDPAPAAALIASAPVTAEIAASPLFRASAAVVAAAKAIENAREDSRIDVSRAACHATFAVVINGLCNVLDDAIAALAVELGKVPAEPAPHLTAIVTVDPNVPT